jgi:hypothetical protein
MADPGDWVVIAKLQAQRTYIQEQSLLFWKLDFNGMGELCEHFLSGNRKTEHRRKHTEMTDDSRIRRASPVGLLASPVSTQQKTTAICSLTLGFQGAAAGNVFVSLCGASGNTPYWVLWLVY